MNLEIEKLIRLLIVGEGLHEAEQITSSLRAAGMQVRAEFADDSETMGDILASKNLDLVLFSNDLPDFTLQQAQHLIRKCGRHVVLISMAQNPTQELIVKSISAGAQDVVSSDNLEHLHLVIKREAYALGLWRKSTRLELDILESEKRCQSLLANSRDAVAYVHEGMHIFANESYMELFGTANFSTNFLSLVAPRLTYECAPKRAKVCPSIACFCKILAISAIKISHPEMPIMSRTDSKSSIDM